MSVSTAPSVAKNTEIVTTQATNTSDEKIYIDNKTGKILTTINTEKSEDYTAYSSNQKISVFLPKLITS